MSVGNATDAREDASLVELKVLTLNSTTACVSDLHIPGIACCEQLCELLRRMLDARDLFGSPRLV